MEIIADTHLHLYPCFDLDRAFSVFLDRLSKENRQATRVACLAERFDCDYYNRLRVGEELLTDFIVEVPDKNSLVLKRKSDNNSLTLLPGRQIIAAERIEVLALCTSATFTTGMAAADLIKAIQEHDGIPVLPWSPGKWFSQRGRVIDVLLQAFSNQDFLVGDVSLRPLGWATPLLMRKAGRLGYKIVSGSDPLPFSGEEERFGMYGSRVRIDGNESAPDVLLRSLLQGKAATVTNFGRRSTPVALFNRLRNNAMVKKQADG